MKLLRVGVKGKEKPAALDKNGKIRDLSSLIADLNPDTVNFETIKKLESIDLESLTEISNSERIGACINKPGKFVAIGLNYSDHAAESGMDAPSEPIVFMKATSSINGPNDDIEISKDYSTDRSSFFINGVLDKILKDFTASKRLNKIGRGLI